QPPDGGHVLVEKMVGSRSLSLMDPDGTNLRTVYTISAGEIADGCDFGSVQFTPDGHRIIFQRRPAGDTDGGRVYSVNVDGSGRRGLRNDPHMVFEGNVSVSPDGSQVAFNRWDNTIGRWAIEPIGVVSIGGGTTRSVGPTPVPDGAAFTWSPDGKSIIS